MARLFLVAAAVTGLLGVALGAFGAHGLKERIDPAMLAVFRTAVHYQTVHGLALFGAGLLALRQPSRPLAWAGGLFLAGMLLFSGSLYLMALSGSRALGLVTPIGGLTLMAGWLLLAVAAWRLPRPGAG